MYACSTQISLWNERLRQVVQLFKLIILCDNICRTALTLHISYHGVSKNKQKVNALVPNEYLQAFRLQIHELHHEFGLFLMQEKSLLNSKMQHPHLKC